MEDKPKQLVLPNPRYPLLKKVKVCRQTIYVFVSFFENGEPGEVFFILSKQGSTLRGIFDAYGITVSLSLQYGVPWLVLRDKMLHHRFEPSDDENPSLIHAVAITIDEMIVYHKEQNKK